MNGGADEDYHWARGCLHSIAGRRGSYLASPPITPEMIREHVERVLSDRRFVRSERLGRFLRYTVEKTLTGEGEALKEYLIALEVYDKPPSYDPSVDSLVRVEASRLRAKLFDYYGAEGSGDVVRLEFPKGSYAPVFRWAQPVADVEMPAAAEEQQELTDGPLQPSSPFHKTPFRFAWLVLVVAAIAGVIGFSFRERLVWPQTAQRYSIAVLPLINFSPSPERSIDAAQLTRDLQLALARETTWKVMSASSAPAGAEGSSFGATAAQSGVDTLLQGTINAEADKVRVHLQLISAGDGSHLWSGIYDASSGTDRTALSGTVVQSMSAARSDWTRKLSGTDEAGREARRLTYNARGVLRSGAKDHLAMRSPEQERPRRLSDIMTAIGGLERAITLDPQYGSAYGVLASAYSLAATFDERLSEKAREAAIRALQVEETLADAHFVLGYAKFLNEWDFAGARAELKRTLELDPRNVTAYRLYADASVLTGDPQPGFAALRHARRLVPDSAVIAVQAGIMMYNTRRFEELVEYSRVTQDAHPEVPAVHWLRGLSLEQQGRYPAARAAFEKCLQLSPGDARALPALGHLLGVSGRTSEALKIIEVARRRATKGALGPFSIALVYVGLKDRKSAFEWLEAARERREGALPYIKVDPRWDTMRSDPAFTALLRKLSL